MNPLLLIAIFLSLCAAVVFLFWPGIGIWGKWRAGRKNTERVLIEDALKHLFDQEYKGTRSTLHSLAGGLVIPAERAAKVVARLQSLGLVDTEGDGFALTDEGRRYALKMVRIHRLWESYLADETGLEEREWHRKAEILEHNMTDSETASLAAAIGNPRYDPHGDPIPTSTGSVPPKTGIPLTDLPTGVLAGIVHIEDEPESIYAQLVALELHPGMKIQIAEKNAQRIRFIADGEDNVLAPVAAAHITVVPLPKEQEMAGPYESLSALKPGERGKVITISKNCRGQQRRRLMDLGVVPGAVITMEMSSASGDPVAYNICGATIAIRRNQANMIFIERIEETVHDTVQQ